MTTQIRLPEHQIADLATIRGLQPQLLQSIIRELEGLESVPLRPGVLLAAIQGALGDQAAAAESVTRVALSSNGLMRQLGLSAEEFAAGLRAAIEREAEWASEAIQQWSQIEPYFRELIGLRAVRLVANATAAELGTTAEPFLRRAQRLDDQGSTDAALDLLYDSIDELMRTGRHSTINSIFCEISPTNLSLDLLLGILTATLPARSRLPARAKFLEAVREELRRRGEHEETLLTGL